MDNKTYIFDVNGKEVVISTQEIVKLYGLPFGLTEAEIERYAGRCAAQRKYYRACDQYLDKTLVKRLIREERLMKKGEADGFKLQLTFDWYIVLKKDSEQHLPYKFVVKAWCLDNMQTFDRGYVSIEAALLHCLNGFNENTSINNRYSSIEQYILK